MNKVFVAQDPLEAHFVRGLLERQGIDAEIRGELLFGLRGKIPITSDTLPSVWVVEDSQLERALEFIAAYERGKKKNPH